MVRTARRTPPKRAWPAKTVTTLAPSAAIRSCTAFWAPVPSATMMITAPTPMMMPSMVSSDRSLLARIARKATTTVSPSSTSARSAGWRLLLPHAGHRPATGHPVGAVLHLLLRLHQARARKQQHRVGLAQSAHHLTVVKCGEAGPYPSRRWTPRTRDEDDVPAAIDAFVSPGAAVHAATAGLADLVQHRRFLRSELTTR